MDGIEDYHSDGQMLLTILFTSGGLGMIRYVGHRSCQAIFSGMNLASARPEFGKGMNGFGYRIPHQVLTQESIGGKQVLFQTCWSGDGLEDIRADVLIGSASDG